MYIAYIYLFTILGGIYYLIRSTFPPKVTTILTDDEPLVSIIIPARNEERNIGRLLNSLTKLSYRNREIIVVDGSSDDRTVEIASNFSEVSVINEPKKPESWVGKPWACYTGYQHAKGEILLFTDADTWHDPESLTLMVSELQESLGFVSFLTTQEFKSFWEHMLAIVFLIISITVRGTKGTGRVHIANGQYMLFTRERYEQLGTHKVVAHSIIEDLAFGTHGAKQGYPPRIVSKRNLVTARMYQSLSEIKEGFGKNLGLGVGEAGIDSIISAGFISAWGLGWLLVLPISYISTGSISTFTLVVCSFGYLSFAFLLIGLENRLSTTTTLYPLIYPLYFMVFQVIVLISVINTYVRKEISWKDRAYQI